jgi:hypothetical protein
MTVRFGLGAHNTENREAFGAGAPSCFDIRSGCTQKWRGGRVVEGAALEKL